LRTSAELAFLPLDLSTSTSVDGAPPFGLPFAAARRIVASDRALWLATDQGVVRLTLPDRRTTRWNEVNGLPDPRTLSLVLHQGRMVAGTMRGLAEVQDDGTAERLAMRFIDPAYALLSRGDTLWVGTPSGCGHGCRVRLDSPSPRGSPGLVGRAYRCEASATSRTRWSR
jgi:ligand-binding sensor domain-containing protein